jgi:pullulanase/glycogen debranching enzyme
MSGYYHLNFLDTTIRNYPGTPYPLGAFYDGHGTNFALYSENATKVELCLFKKSAKEAEKYIEHIRINIEGKYSILSLIELLIIESSGVARKKLQGGHCPFQNFCKR